MPSPRHLEIDVFAGFNPVTASEVEILKEVRARMVIIGLDWEDDDRNGADRSDYFDRWRRKIGVDALDRSIERCKEAGLMVGVHYWLRAFDPWDRDAHRFISELAAKHELDLIMADGERHLLKLPPKNGLSHAEWLETVWMPRWLDKPLAPMGAAVYGYPDKHDTFAALARRVGYVVPMAYGSSNQAGDYPGQIQRISARKWQRELAGTDVVIGGGLGVWNMARPGYNERTAIVETAKGWINQGVTRLALWNLEFCDKNTRLHRVRRQAIREIHELEIPAAAATTTKKRKKK